MTLKEIIIAIVKRIFCFHRYELSSTIKFYANSEGKYIIVVDLKCLKCNKNKKIITFNDKW